MNYSKCSFSTTLWITLSCLTLGFAKTPEKLNPNNEICGSLKHGSGNKLNILAVGMRKNGLILITKDWMVYDLPKTSLDSDENRMYLYDPEDMRTKFPKLWNNRTFQKIKNNLRDSIVVVGDEQELLCFVTYKPVVNLIYDLNSHSVTLGWYLDDQDKLIFISTPKSKRFHATKKGTKGTEMDTWGLNQDRVIHETDYYRSICWAKKSEEIFMPESDKGCGKLEPVQWPMMKGFVGDNKFYLFDQGEIHVFPYDVWSAPKPSSQPLINVKYVDFFWCSRNPAEFRALILWIILIILVLLLLIVLIVGYYRYYKARKKRKGAHKHKKSKLKSSGKSSSKKTKTSKKKSKRKSGKKHRSSSKSRKKRTGRTSKGRSKKKKSKKRKNHPLIRGVKKDNSSRF